MNNNNIMEKDEDGDIIWSWCNMFHDAKLNRIINECANKKPSVNTPLFPDVDNNT